LVYIRKNGVSTALDSAGKVLSAGGISAGSMPDGSSSASGYPAGGVPAGGEKPAAPTVAVNLIPTKRVNTVHPQSQIIGDLASPIQTRSRAQKSKTKWILKNKKDARGIVVRNKAMLVAQAHRQEEGIDYDEVFAPVARIEAIRLFLAFTSYMGFLHNNRRGTIDKTLFIKRNSRDILLVQVYVDDIIFGSTNKAQCEEFKALMKAAKSKLKDESDPPVNVHLYRSMIGSLMYLTASRTGIMFAVSACSRHQVTPLTSHLNAVKKIFK
nr:hypothetical protein [Tanacetum cinerariifolium]